MPQAAHHRDKHGELHQFDRPAGDDHGYTYTGALSQWHDEQLQAIGGGNYSINEDFDLLEKEPEPPEALPDDALPITAIAHCGDVQWRSGEWPRGRGFCDIDMGASDCVFDVLADINRFAFYKFEGDECVVGWLYKAPEHTKRTNTVREETKVYVRDDVLKRYGDPEYCDYYDCQNYWVRNPRAYGEHFDAYDEM